MNASPRTRPELLAPAGDREAMRAAVANGADAVYFGLSKYSARQRAANFRPEELPETIAYLHDHNVRGYVAFNTLIFSDELAQAAEFATTIATAGADAAIVQDLGLAQLIHRLAPTLPIHASTQMTLTEPRGIETVRRLGIQRVILARELSIAEIRAIAESTAMPLEVFIHGALCMSYSGQCLASEALWGRSANRGLCGQACRLPYRLIVSGRPRDLGDRLYLLSTKDLAAHDRIAELVRIGIAGFKIEGRLKSAHYVASATQVYRAAIDAAVEGRTFSLPREDQLGLTQSFSRGFTHGFLDGANHQDLVHGRFPKSRGVRIGTVVGKTESGVLVECAGETKTRGPSSPLLKPGDGIVFDEGRPAEDEQGGRAFSVRKKGARNLFLTFGKGDVNLGAVSVGSTVWKTDDPRLRRELEKSYAREIVVRRVPLFVSITARAGEPARVRVADGDGNAAEVAGGQPLEEARNRPLTRELVREQIGRLGDTPFELADVEILGEDATPAASAPVMVPKSVLNDLRRQAVNRLLQLRRARARHAIAEPDALAAIRREISALRPPGAEGEVKPRLYVLVRSLDQLGAVLDCRPAAVCCDFADVSQYAEAVVLSRAAGVPVGLATVRITKPGEESLLQGLLEAGPDMVLVRSLGALCFLRTRAPSLPLVGDFSLNVANEISASVIAETGLARITPAYDCNWTQLAAMLGRFPPAWFELVIHLHVPLMYMEHCVPAAHLSRGRDSASCGSVCERGNLELRDRVGAEHPLVSDARCGSTLFSAHVQSAIDLVPEMLRAGVRHFRIELLRETADETRAILDIYSRALAGRVGPEAALMELQAHVPAGVKRGTWNSE